MCYNGSILLYENCKLFTRLWRIPKMKCRPLKRDLTILQITHITALNKVRNKETKLNNFGKRYFDYKLRVKDKKNYSRMLYSSG